MELKLARVKCSLLKKIDSNFLCFFKMGQRQAVREHRIWLLQFHTFSMWFGVQWIPKPNINNFWISNIVLLFGHLCTSLLLSCSCALKHLELFKVYQDSAYSLGILINLYDVGLEPRYFLKALRTYICS